MTELVKYLMYRSNHPEVIAAWEKFRRQERERAAELVSFQAEVDGEHDRTLVFNQGTYAVGLVHLTSWPVPTGWLYRALPNPHIVPDDALVAERLRSLSTAYSGRHVLYPVGMPLHITRDADGPHGEHPLIYMQGLSIGGRWVIVAWPAGSEPVGAVDEDLWSEVPDSEYGVILQHLGLTVHSGQQDG